LKEVYKKYFSPILSTVALISVIIVSLVFSYKTVIDMNNKKTRLSSS